MSTRSLAISAPSGAAPAAAAETPVDRGAGATRGPLCEADLVQLERAAARLRSLRRAALLARVHGLSMLGLAMLCLPLSAFDPAMLWVALVLAASGASELHGARLLRALNPRGPKWLAVQQIALLGAIAAYCAAAVHTGLSTDSVTAELALSHPQLAQALDDGGGQAEQMLGALDGAYRAAVVGFYLTVLIASALYQGAVAWFHASRGALLRAHLRETPRWVHEAMRRLCW